VTDNENELKQTNDGEQTNLLRTITSDTIVTDYVIILLVRRWIIDWTSGHYWLVRLVL